MASNAYSNFLDALLLAEALLQLEATYNDPPPPADQKRVEALRGGANVLMVAAFESYLKELIEEHLSVMAVTPIAFKLHLVPEKMKRLNIEIMLDRIKRMDSAMRFPEYQRFAQVIVSQAIVPDVFTETIHSNPSPENFKRLFQALGINDIFKKIKSKFDQALGQTTPSKYIELTLASIVDNRHLVAHAATALTISRVDLQNWLKFFKLLGEVCDVELEAYIAAML